MLITLYRISGHRREVAGYDSDYYRQVSTKIISLLISFLLSNLQQLVDEGY